jgi:hypothetical protein
MESHFYRTPKTMQPIHLDNPPNVPKTQQRKLLRQISATPAGERHRWHKVLDQYFHKHSSGVLLFIILILNCPALFSFLM